MNLSLESLRSLVQLPKSIAFSEKEGFFCSLSHNINICFRLAVLLLRGEPGKEQQILASNLALKVAFQFL